MSGMIQMTVLLLIGAAGVIALMRDWRSPEKRREFEETLFDGWGYFKEIGEGLGVFALFGLMWLGMAALVVGTIWLIIDLPSSGPVVIPSWAFVFLVFWVCSNTSKGNC